MSRMHLWGLTLLPHLGSITICRLVRAFGGEESAYYATAAELGRMPGITPAKAREVVAARAELDLAHDWAQINGIETLGVTTWLDQDYPQRLLQISDPPPVLYYRGDLACVTGPTIAVVGRRRASPRGLGWAKRLGRELGAHGVTVVSGLALGIDAAAHRGALATGRTAAVLGTGLNCMYPRSNSQLAENIARQGVLISSFLPEMPPLRGNFPARNRIISGLSLGVVVVEAGERSGSLITANLAVDQNRDVYAVPGDPGDVGAAGPNRLIQSGAKLIRGANDVLEEMHLSRQLVLPFADQSAEPDCKPRSGVAGQLLDCLRESLHVDEISLRTGLPVSELSGALMTLVLQGLVEEVVPGVFQSMD